MVAFDVVVLETFEEAMLFSVAALLLFALKEEKAKNIVSRQTRDVGKKIFFNAQWVFRGY